MISKLEAEVGLVLLERSAAGTKLTPAGNQILEHANEVCDAYLGFADTMKSLARRLDREVLVAVDQSWFGERLKQHIAEHPPAALSAPPVFCNLAGRWGDALKSRQVDVVVAGRFLRAGLSPEIQEAVIKSERGITVAWNPDFHPFDTVHFNFPEVLRTTVLIPSPGVVAGFDPFLTMWCDYAYGIQPANTLQFDSEGEAATAAAAGLGVLLAPGDAIPRLGEIGATMTHVRTFEFLLPEAFNFGVYCRSDEDSKLILNVAATMAKTGRKLFC